MASSIDFIPILWFVFLGLIGGITHVIVKAESWGDLKDFRAFKRSILGAICGFIYYNLYSDYSFPNTVMAFVSGYMGTDFILSIVEKFWKKGDE